MDEVVPFDGDTGIRYDDRLVDIRVTSMVVQDDGFMVEVYGVTYEEPARNVWILLHHVDKAEIKHVRSVD